MAYVYLELRRHYDNAPGINRASLGPRPSRDLRTKKGPVSNVRFLGCAESACERELCNLT